MADQSSAGKASSPSGRQALRAARDYVLPLFLLMALVAAVYVAIITMSPFFWLWIARVLFIVLAGALPVMIYSYFIQGRGRILFREYKQALRRLGFPEAAEQYQEKFEAVYGPVRFLDEDRAATPGADVTDRRDLAEVNTRPLNSPIVMATLLGFLGWILVFFPPLTLPDQLVPNPTPLAYGFLGAYVFGLGSLVRQYVTDDLQPRYYASLVLRYLTVFALSALIGLALPLQQAAEAIDGTQLSIGVSDQILIVAFFVGLFPSMGLRLIQRAATSTLGKFKIKAFEEDQPLSLLDGLTIYQEDRLLLEGVENLQNLASSNIVDLMLKTRFSVEQIVDWVDQALLHMHTGEYTVAFKNSAIRTATDFLDVYRRTPETRRQALAELLVSQLPKDDNRPVTLTATHALALFEALAVALETDPNMFNVRYWRSHAFEALPDDIERTRISADLQLMQGLTKGAIEVYDRLLHEFPNLPSALLYRGLAYFMRKDYDHAIVDYTEAIRLGGEHWTNARYAYVERGRALRQIEEYEEAAENYREALAAYPDFYEAQLEWAYLQSTRFNQYEAAIKNLDEVIAGKFNVAEAEALRGTARYDWWKTLDRAVEHPIANLAEARADLQSALHHKPELIQAYINLAAIYKELGQPENQEKTLTKALEQLDRTPAPDSANSVRLARGYLHLQHGRLAQAIEDFKAAAQSVPSAAAAYVFLGSAYIQQADWANALTALQQAAERDTTGEAVRPELITLGEGALAQNQLEIARQALLLAVPLAKASRDFIGQARAQLGLSRIYHAQAAWPDARREANEAAQAARARDEALYTEAIYELGVASWKMGEAHDGVKQLTTSAALFEALDRKRDSAQAYYQLAQAAPEVEAKRKATKKARAQLESLGEAPTEADEELQAALNELEKTLPRMFGLG
ncbi:MAG: tetratricopeptide repeat protein [Thermoflexales bacterium]|nr:tetratricopeptide repeat protein [Thermoflexales bacterium]